MSTKDPTEQATSPQPAPAQVPGERYEIRVRGHLGARWAAWFDGLALTDEDDGTTVIAGRVADQAALHGLIEKLRDLGIPLLSLARLATSDGPPTEPTQIPHDQPDTNPPGAPS